MDATEPLECEEQEQWEEAVPEKVLNATSFCSLVLTEDGSFALLIDPNGN